MNDLRLAIISCYPEGQRVKGLYTQEFMMVKSNNAFILTHQEPEVNYTIITHDLHVDAVACEDALMLAVRVAPGLYTV